MKSKHFAIRFLSSSFSFFESTHLGVYWRLVKCASAINATMATDLNQNALVHVHMTVYNAEQTIKQAVQSVIDQDHTNWKLVIIDDCSTDSTVEILRSLDDPRISIHQNAINQRQWSNRNIAISRGLKLDPTPLFFTTIDSDDIANPDWISSCLSLFTSFSIIGIRPMIERVHEVSLQRVWTAPACCQTMWRREVLETIGGFNPEIMASDSDFMNRARRLAAIKKKQILLSTQPLQRMRHRTESWSQNYNEQDKLIKSYERKELRDLHSPLTSD